MSNYTPIRSCTENETWETIIPYTKSFFIISSQPITKKLVPEIEIYGKVRRNLKSV